MSLLLSVAVAVTVVLVASVPTTSASTSRSAVPRKKYLFLNDALLQNSSGVRWTMHPPVLAEEPAITPERPWEDWGVAATQVIDWAPGDKRLYYTCYERLPGLNAKGEANVVWRLCLATSTDGREWRRKSLGLVEYPPGSGNTDNNIVWPPVHPNGTAASPFTVMTFFRDLNPNAAEDEPYKVMGEIHGASGSGGVAWTTSDGLHFRPLRTHWTRHKSLSLATGLVLHSLVKEPHLSEQVVQARTQ